jgi:hypothetical protein
VEETLVGYIKINYSKVLFSESNLDLDDLHKIIKHRDRNKSSMAYENEERVNRTIGSVKNSILTDPNYSVENDVDEMLYKKAGIRKPKKSPVGIFGFNLYTEKGI